MNFKQPIQKIVWTLFAGKVTRFCVLMLFGIMLAFNATAQAPANDNACQAITLTPAATCTFETFTNANATGSTGIAPPTCANYVAGSSGDVWFKVVVPAGGALTFETQAGEMTNGGMAIYRGSTCVALAVVPASCADDGAASPNMPKTTVTGLVPNSTVYARVWSNSGSTKGTFGICVTIPVPAPDNDEPCTAAELTVGATCTYDTFTNASASSSTGVPAPVCSQFLGGDVWFKVVVPAIGAVVINTQAGVVNDAGMAVYTGSSCTGLTYLDCYDNTSTTAEMPSLTVASLTPGDTLWIRFWERENDNNGTFGICVTLPPPPPANDGPCTAIGLAVDTVCNFLEFTNEDALNTSTVPDPGCANYQGADVWFTAVVPAGGAVTIDTEEGTMDDGGMAVYRGTCSNLTILSCDDDGGVNNMPKLTLGGLVPGDTIWIRIWDAGNFNNGTFGICVKVPPPPPTNDEPCNSISLIADTVCNFQQFTNENATGTVGPESPGCARYEGSDVWFNVVVPPNGGLIFDSRAGVITDGGMAIYRGSCDSLELLDCSDDVNGQMPKIIAGGLTPGDTIWVRFWEYANDNNGTFDICVKIPPPPPANDEPCGAFAIAVDSVCNYQEFTTESATETTTVPDPGCAGFGGSDVWFTTIVPAGGAIKFDTQGGVITDGGMAVYSGSCANLTLIDCDDDAGTGNMPQLNLGGLTPGDTLWVRVWESGDNNNGTFGICFTIPPPPPLNDDPCGAVELAVNSACTYQTYTNESATGTTAVADPGCADYSGTDVWFMAIVPAGGAIAFDTEEGVMDDGGMAIYSGNCNNLTLIECDDNSSANGDMPKITVAGLNPGDTIWVRVWENGNDNNGTFGICASVPPPPPANDNPCSAQPITPDSVCNFQTYTNENATNSPNVPEPGCSSYLGGDVWFSVVVPSGGALSFESQADVITDGGFALYTGTCNNLTLVDCDDDGGDGFMPFIEAGGLTPGDTVWVRFWEYGNNNNGTFGLCVTIPPPGPINDNSCGATLLTADSVCNYQTFTTENAYGSAGVPDPGCANYQGGDVWFSVVVPIGGALTFDTQADDITDGGMAIYKGRCDSLELVDCDDDNGAGDMPKITSNAFTPGDTIWIRFWARGNFDSGNFGICVTIPPPPPANDDPCGAVGLIAADSCSFTYFSNESSFNTASVPAPACGDYVGSDVWFKVTVPAAGAININTIRGSMIDGAMALYTADSCNGTMTLVDCDDNSSSNQDMPYLTPTGLTPGSTLWIRIWSAGSAVNSGTFGICATIPPLQPATFSFACARDTSFNCGGGDSCFTLDAIIPNIHALTDRYAINPLSAQGCFNPYADPNNEGPAVDLAIDDIYTDVINLPFTFPFFGSNYNSLIASTNGLVSFDVSEATNFSHWGITEENGFLGAGTSTTATPVDLPSDLYDRALIMGPYHDLDPQHNPNPGQRIKYNVTGQAPHRRWILSFANVPLYTTGGARCDTLTKNTHQIVLYEGTGVVEVFLFGVQNCTQWNQGRAMVGMQDFNRTNGIMAPGRRASDAPWGRVGMNESWRFVPVGGPSLFKRVELFDTSGNFLATGDTSSVDEASLKVNFRNLCALNRLPAGQNTLLVRAVYQKFNDPTQEEIGADTIQVFIPNLKVNFDVNDALCVNDTGSIAIHAISGLAPLRFSADSGTTWQSDSVFTNLAAGRYYVKVQDAAGCARDTIVTIASPTAVSATLAATAVSCNGGNDGVITVTGTGGSGVYTYAFDGGAFADTSSASFAAGTYPVIIQDGNGCTKDTSFVITEPAVLTVQVTPADASCTNPLTGQLTVTATGGTGPYTYNFVDTTFGTSNVYTGAQGSYTIAVRDLAGCLATAAATIGLTNDLVIQGRGDTIICGNGRVRLNTTSSATSYSWTPASSLDDSTLASPFASPSVTTDYYLTATLGTCTATDTVRVAVATAPVVFAGNDIEVVKGADAQINASVTNVANYNWSPTTYLNNPNSLSPVAVMPQQTTVYALTGFNAEGCSVTDSVKVTVIPYCIKAKNAFTPNGDGVNDTWMVYDQFDCLTNVKVLVFNRYGSKVFESSNYRNDWKGTFNGKSLPDATYYYVIDYKLVSGTVLQLRGDVTILR